MLLECGCGKMYRVRDGATNPPKNCPACGGALRVAGAAPAAPPPAPAAPSAPDPKLKDLEGKLQGLERDAAAARAALELKEKELQQAQANAARLGSDLEKAQGALKEAQSKKESEIADRSAQTTKLLLAKDEQLRELREKVESLEAGAGDSEKLKALEQELADARQGKVHLAEELAKIESTYRTALKSKEEDLEKFQKKVQELEKGGGVSDPRGLQRIAALEKIVQDGEQRYRAIAKELEDTKQGHEKAVESESESRKKETVTAQTLLDRERRIKELESELDKRDAELEKRDEELSKARGQVGAAPPPAPQSGLSTSRLGEARYLSTDLDRGLASISTALNGLVSRVRRLNETLQSEETDPVPAASAPAPEPPAPETRESEPAPEEEPAAKDEESPADLPLVEPPSAEPDAPPELPADNSNDETPVEPVPALESFQAPEEEVSSLPDDGTLLDMGKVNREKLKAPPPEEAAAEEPAEPASEPEPEPEKKGFFGKLFGGGGPKKKQKPAF